MRKDLLAWGIIRRMTVWGFAGGAGVGLLYGFLVFYIAGSIILSPIAGVMGLLIGGFTGFGLGLLDGCVLAVLIHLVQHRSISPARYRAMMCIVSALLTGVLALPILTSSASEMKLNGKPTAWIVYALIPALIAAIVAVIASAKVVTWVEGNTPVVINAK